MSKRIAVIIFGISIFALLIVLFNQQFGKSFKNDDAQQLSPWDSLTPEEITTASKAIKAAHDGEIIFNRISLRLPEKDIALAWQAGNLAPRGAEITFRSNGKNHIAQYDFGSAKLSSIQEIENGQQMFSSYGELLPAITLVNDSDAVKTAFARRKIAPGDGLCLPRTVGRYFADMVDVVNNRIVRFDCFYIRGQTGLRILPSTSAFARPIEGISFLFNIDSGDILDFKDSYNGAAYPPHDIEAMEYHKGAMDTRAPLNPITISRPSGRNFDINGSGIDWQGWHFHLRFDARQGTVLNRVGHNTPSGFRSVAYEIAMAEMFVPYQDTDPHWYYRAYFDMGEYGFGSLSTELKDNDCPNHAVFMNVTLHTADGMPLTADNRICIFEHDPGLPIWRHHEALYDDIPGIAKHHSRKATELVVRMAATIGNYDYFQDYVFQQDGRLRIRLMSTGVDAAKGVFAKTLQDETASVETEHGTLIAPHRLGVNHDHYFNYRIDLDVDGTANNFDLLKLVPIAQDAASPRQSIWAVKSERPINEQQAQIKMQADKPALLVFSNAQKTNAMGYPTGYQIIMNTVKPIVTYSDSTYQRAAFIQNNLWVTKQNPDEIFAAGLPVNQSIGGLGLPQYIANNESILETDLVAWPTIGFHHVPMAEDWPVLPAKIDEIILQPRNFFDRNPAIDLP